MSKSDGSPRIPKGSRDQNIERFLRAYASIGTVTGAAAAIGLDRGQHYDWMARVPGYPERFAAAQETNVDLLEAEAHRRAMAGSDRLIIFLLKGKRAEVYGDKVAVTTTSSEDDSAALAALLTRLAADDELAEAAEKLIAAVDEALGPAPVEA